MGNCIRTEMWKAFHNKMMRSALLIGFILVIADLVQTAITVSDLGASYAHSPGGYDGCSLFVNWIGVNGVTVGAVVFYAVWPFLAAMPYGWSLYEDNRSHMTNNILTRVPYSQYLTAKMAAVFVSGRHCYCIAGNYGSVCIRDGMSRLYSSGCTAYYRILFRHSLFGEAILYPPLAACNHLVRY